MYEQQKNRLGKLPKIRGLEAERDWEYEIWKEKGMNIIKIHCVFK